MEFDFSGARKAGATDEQIAKYLAENYADAFDFGGAFEAGASAQDVVGYLESKYARAPEAPKEEGGDFLRGAGEAFQQVPQLGYGLLAGAGAVAEKVAGEGGISTAIKQKGVEGYQRWGEKVAEGAKESDSWSHSYDKAKEGDFNALVDWFQHGLGYAAGQGVQILGTAGLGALAAKGAGIGASRIAAGMVAKESAKIAATEAGAKLAAEELAKVATANVAAKIGQNAALAATAFGMEGGEIYGDLVSEASKAGRELSGADLGKAFVATAAAGGLEFVGDRLGLDLMLGKKVLGLTGVGGRVARGVTGAATGVVGEGATEYGQTLIEEYGKGKDPFSPEALRGALDAAALGALGGAAMGGAGGAISRSAEDVQAAQPEDIGDARLALPNRKYDTMFVFSDGSTGTQSQVDEYLKNVPEQDRAHALASMMYGANAPETENVEQAAETRRLGLPYRPHNTMYSFSDGSTGTQEQIDAYLNSLDPQKRPSALASMMYGAKIVRQNAPRVQPEDILSAPTADDAIAKFTESVESDNINADELLAGLDEPALSPAAVIQQEQINAIPPAAEPVLQPDLGTALPAGDMVRPVSEPGPGIAAPAAGTDIVGGELAAGTAQRAGDAAGVDARVPDGVGGQAVDRRATPRETTVRRSNVDLRQKYDAMPPEDRAAALEELHRKAYVSDLTGLQNKRAFDEHVTANPQAKVLYGDVDGLKALNTRYGHNGADQILKAVGEVKAAVAADMGVNAFHRSGDEFLAVHTDPAILDSYGAEVQKRLDSATVEVTLPDGTVERHVGIGLSYGVGENDKIAETRANTQKAARKSGTVLGEAAGRNENQQGGNAEAQVTPEKPDVIAAKPAETAQSEQLTTEYKPVFGANSAGKITLRGVPAEQIKAVRDKLGMKGVIIGKDNAVFPKGADLKTLQAAFEVAPAPSIPKEKPEETSRTESGAGDNQEAGRDEAKPAAEQVAETSTAQAGNVNPEPLTFEQFAARNGASRQGIGEAALHRSSERKSPNTHRRQVEAQAEADRQLILKRAELQKEYDALVGDGKIRVPSHKEQTIATANGHPDNEATQAARRIAEKRGWNWRESGAANETDETKAKKLEVLKAQAAGKISGDQGAALKELADAGEHAAVDEVLKPASVKPIDTSAKPVEKSAENVQIDDFGEKLGGARKDLAAAIKQEYSDSDIASLPLSKIWPADLAEKIEDKFVAAFAFAARQEIPSKPRVKYKVDSWVKKVKMLRDLAGMMTDSETTRIKADALLKETKALEGFNAKISLLESIDREQWKRIGKVWEYPNAYTYDADGKQVPAPSVLVEIDGRRERFDGAKSVGEVIDQVNEKLGVAAKGKRMEFEVRGRAGAYFINKKGDPLYRKLKEFTDSKEAMAFKYGNYDELVAAWEAVKDSDNVKESDLRTRENRERTAENWRKGKDVTPEQFITEFGFRGVEFGLWVKQGKNAKERQGMLNAAYDALMDLSSIINVPPKALSLEGTLGLGFGSRGSGAASAHFEPDTLVINLTKTRGAGTLAHEWFHSLDNYFQLKRGKPATWQREDGYITYNPENYYVHKHSGQRLPERAFNKMIEGETHPDYGRLWESARDRSQWEKKEGVRTEVGEAFSDLVKALNDSPMAKRASLIDNGKSGGYWSRIIERGARSFENYVIHKMMLKGYHNDYLANVTPANEFRRDAGRYPYLLEGEIEPVAEAFDTLFQTIKTKETDKGVALFSRSNPQTIPSDEFKAIVLEKSYGGKGIDLAPDGSKYLAAIHRKTNRGIFVVDGTLNRDVFKAIKEEADAAGLDQKKLYVFADLATYQGHGVDVMKLDELPGGRPISNIQFSAGQSSNGLSVSAVESIANPIADKLKNVRTVKVVERQTEIPGLKEQIDAAYSRFQQERTAENLDKYLAVAKDDIEGAYVNGELYLVASNLSSSERVTEVLRHEVAHLSVEQMLEEAKPGLYDSLLKNVRLLDKAGNKYIRELAAAVDRTQPGLDERTRSAEIIAQIAERGDHEKYMPGVIRSLWQRISDGIKAFYKLVFGDTLNDQDVRDIVAQSFRWARGEQDTARVYGGESMNMSRADLDFTKEQAQDGVEDAGRERERRMIETLKALYGGEEGYENLTIDADRYLRRYSDPSVGYLKQLHSARKLKEGSEAVQRRLLEQEDAAPGSSGAGAAAFATLESRGGIGHFDGFVTEANLQDIPHYGNYFAMEVWPSEFDGKDGAIDSPILTLTVNPTDDTKFSEDNPHGELVIYGPKYDSETFRILQARGWAEVAHGKNGEVAYLPDGKPWTRLTGVSISQLNSLLSEAHARIRLATGAPHLGINWDRATGATGFATEHGDKEASRKSAIYFSRQGSLPMQGGEVGNSASWDSPEPSKLDDIIYTLQDKHIDMKRVVQAVKDAGGKLIEKFNPYLAEELFHGRAAKRTQDFVNTELKPLLADMRLRGLSVEELDQYLHARHAKEANALIAERDPDIPDGGSGMTNAEADEYMAGLGDKKARLEAAAARVDSIITRTRDLYVSYGLISKDQADSWADMFRHYVPLMREDHDGGMGMGQGFSIRGKEAKHRTGSKAKVVDILANIALQREKAITRGEKNRVAVALAGLAKLNPNPDFWTFDKPPVERVLNEKTGLVEDRIDPTFKSDPNVVIAKIKDASGQVHERAVIFNKDNDRAVRMAEAFKNLDHIQLGGVMGVSATITRYFASVNTQYNPVFGIVNITRDVQGMALNLSSTPLAKHRMDVLKLIPSAVKGIYQDSRAERKGRAAKSKWAQLWEELQDEGGMTGYRDLYKNSADRAEAIEKELDPTKWHNSALGKVFTANGTLKVPLSYAQKKAGWLFDWLSDYNQTLEGATRLAAYKVAIDNGMTKQQAASLAKSITVNFNRKGHIGQQAGAMYAFFNAAMQGTARIAQTMLTYENGKVGLTKAGKAIVYGGMTLGALQAVALAAVGFDDDEPPEFVRERSLILPIGGKKYITLPMPLGFHVFPNLGRIPMEWALGGFEDTGKRITDLVGIFLEAFNPMGSAGMSLQTFMPTAIDPMIALAENKDWTGKPIYKEDFNSMKPTPGFERNKDTATAWSKGIAEGLNYLTGGTEYTPGAISPTADQLDYLIGQVTGGVGRELGKVAQTGEATVTGEALPPHKVPLLGRFYGNAENQSSQGNAYYSNLKRIYEVEAEIKGRREDRLPAEEYKRENPEWKLITRAKYADNIIHKLKKQKRELMDRGAEREKIRSIEDRITNEMRRLNDAVMALEEKEAA